MIDISFAYKAMPTYRQVIRTLTLWLYRPSNHVYALVLIEPLHPPASVYLQMNHLSTSGRESSPFSTV